MKNKLENQIEGAGLRRSPMGILLEALGQQEEGFQKIQSLLEGKLKEWSDLEKSWRMLFTHLAQRIWNFFLDVSGFLNLLALNSELWLGSAVCSCAGKGLQVDLRVSVTPPRTRRGTFLSEWRWMLALCYAAQPMFLHTWASFLDLKSAFNQPQQQQELQARAQPKTWRQWKAKVARHKGLPSCRPGGIVTRFYFIISHLIMPINRATQKEKGLALSHVFKYTRLQSLMRVTVSIFKMKLQSGEAFTQGLGPGLSVFLLVTGAPGWRIGWSMSCWSMSCTRLSCLLLSQQLLSVWVAL